MANLARAERDAIGMKSAEAWGQTLPIPPLVSTAIAAEMIAMPWWLPTDSRSESPEVISVASSSNRLITDQSVAGSKTLSYDAASNVLNDGVVLYTYSDRGRLASAKVGSKTAAYRYNALEQRLYKSGPTSLIASGAAYYVYDEAGHLIGEYNANLVPVSETVYLGDTPVAVLKYVKSGNNNNPNWSTSLSFVYADHLDAPRVIVRSTDHAIQWRWDNAEPYGDTPANANPNGLGVFTFNQRLPGQVYDAETANLYNWHRDYNPRLGRYLQSDPIGLNGGINSRPCKIQIRPPRRPL